MVGALIREEAAGEKVGWHFTCFGDPQAFQVELTEAPKEVESVVNCRVIGGRTIIAGVSGGVRVQPRVARLPAVDRRGPRFDAAESAIRRRGQQPETPRRPMVVGLNPRRSFDHDVFHQVTTSRLRLRTCLYDPFSKLLSSVLACVAVVQTVSAADREAVVATVGSDPIRAGEVERLVAKATRGKRLDPDRLRFLQAQSLEEIVARRLVLAYARRTGETADAMRNWRRSGPR